MALGPMHAIFAVDQEVPLPTAEESLNALAALIEEGVDAAREGELLLQGWGLHQDNRLDFHPEIPLNQRFVIFNLARYIFDALNRLGALAAPLIENAAEPQGVELIPEPLMEGLQAIQTTQENLDAFVVNNEGLIENLELNHFRAAAWVEFDGAVHFGGNW